MKLHVQFWYSYTNFEDLQLSLPVSLHHMKSRIKKWWSKKNEILQIHVLFHKHFDSKFESMLLVNTW